MKNNLFNSFFYSDSKREPDLIENNLNSEKGPFLNENEIFFDRKDLEYYKGKSFRFSGPWQPGIWYFNDEYYQDWINQKNILLVCRKSHYSTYKNKPVIIYDEEGNPISIEANENWNIIASSISGTDGVGIKSIESNSDGTFTVIYTDEHQEIIENKTYNYIKEELDDKVSKSEIEEITGETLTWNDL